VGRGLAGRTAGQHPDLTVAIPASRPLRVAVLALLAVDGVLCALAAALLLPSYLGPVWFPLSALIAGLVNAALVWAAAQYTTSGRRAALPMFTWLATIAVLMLGGPGGDVMLGGAGIAGVGPLLLVVLGMLPPLWVLRGHTHASA
jgi:Family of unknown function (DUF6113)